MKEDLLQLRFEKAFPANPVANYRKQGEKTPSNRICFYWLFPYELVTHTSVGFWGIPPAKALYFLWKEQTIGFARLTFSCSIHGHYDKVTINVNPVLHFTV